jgi:hypothetical protein
LRSLSALSRILERSPLAIARVFTPAESRGVEPHTFRYRSG